MRKKWLLIWIALANIDFFVMFSSAELSPLFWNTLIAMVTSFLFIHYLKNSQHNEKIWKHIIAFILDVIVIWQASSSFYDSWHVSSMVNGILSHIYSDSLLLLKIVSFLMAIFMIPFTHYFFLALISVFEKLLKSIDFLKIWTVKSLKIKDVFKSVLICGISIIVSAVCGFILLSAVYSIPLDNIDKNVQKSAIVFQQEGGYPVLIEGFSSTLDNFTDAIMLQEASYNNDGSVIENSLMAYRGGFDQQFPYQSIVNHYINNVEYTERIDYARYWHGYHIFVKPLLVVTDYKTIRMINGIVQIAVMSLICLLMIVKKHNHLIIPVLLSYLILMPVALAMSLQYSSCFYAICLGIILLLLTPKKKIKERAWIVFLAIGIFTAYFDFLTYPIATFGVPAALLLALCKEDETEMKLRIMVEIGIGWCIGFGGMWVSKWILTALLTDFDVFSNALSAINNRVSSIAEDGVTKVYATDVIIKNYQDILRTPFIVLVLIYIFKSMKKIDNSKINVARVMAPYAVLSLAPIVWFIFAKNHSMIHHFFTHKSCIVSIAAILFAIAECRNHSAESEIENK